MKNTTKVIYSCTECGAQSKKWYGQCPECGAWNTLEEEEPLPAVPFAKGGATPPLSKAEALSEMTLPEYIRNKTGLAELDRVLGGGLVQGSVVLLSGEPGIGKSTLLLQICQHLATGQKVLYISGEESKGQLKLRAERLGIRCDGLYILTETVLQNILAECQRIKPDVIMVDSIQTVYTERITSVSGSIAQVRECALALISYAKSTMTSVFLVGHVNKEGGISGPKILEHMVDAVLYFEGDRRQSYRLIRAIKNRYGSTNEIGVFEMGDAGLTEISNPSEIMMEGRPKDVSGSCAVCVMEGTRPLMTEIQSLVCQTNFPSPRRTSDGFDYNRMCLLLAVLERRLRLPFSANDVYLNIAGGLRLDEPAADLAVAMALISAMTDAVIPENCVAFGEIGLSGEVRAVSHAEYRVREAARLGFGRILLPKRDADKLGQSSVLGAQIVGVDSIFRLLPLLKKKEGNPQA